ncbi:energy-coupling factor transporter transmembrane protein EcfT [Paenibacillus sp. ACRRX]|uniref:energy-coupling factor transporter transmembrane component T family protein n=1 Tax=unclassified Paenibacillus TaxID=185978 RepID=UPI001EF3E371|nr:MULTISPECIES: energy-coupling factor transporter transmembrane component T [unclassified Paenibacillus]MCG7408127.1 energy-coupling factor transporter transmembrane protein EcfT [Paenibacillus sp. ACRRX]MDK8181490.1 energy-coupling factor transporter transmembrane component T [Paenibacillus sp. UMB4589-SE434]
MDDRMIMGRYVAAQSWVHQLDPRAKLTAMVLFLIAVICADYSLELAVITAFSLVILMTSSIPLRRYGRASKPLWPLMAFMFLFYVLFEHSGDVWLSIGSFTVTSEGVLLGVYAVWRMLLLVCFTSILTFTTTPIELNLGLEAVLKPLKLIGVSPQQWTMMITIALRFIPTIFEEANKILKAQASRGADYEDLKLKEKGKLVVTLLVPVTVGAFRRAEDLVMAMESRGYVLDAKRTSLRYLTWQGTDTLFILLFIVLTAGMIIL